MATEAERAKQEEGAAAQRRKEAAAALLRSVSSSSLVLACWQVGLALLHPAHITLKELTSL